MPYLKNGFYNRETGPEGVSARWTAKEASMWIPLQGEEERYRFNVRALNTRPGAMAPVSSIHGQWLERARRTYSEKVKCSMGGISL